MKIVIECAPSDIEELSKILRLSTSVNAVKENADKAVEKQDRLNLDRSDPAKICKIIIDGISRMINQDNLEFTDDIN